MIIMIFVSVELLIKKNLIHAGETQYKNKEAGIFENQNWINDFYIIE